MLEQLLQSFIIQPVCDYAATLLGDTFTVQGMNAISTSTSAFPAWIMDAINESIADVFLGIISWWTPRWKSLIMEQLLAVLQEAASTFSVTDVVRSGSIDDMFDALRDQFVGVADAAKTRVVAAGRNLFMVLVEDVEAIIDTNMRSLPN